jgi:aspartate ammonia-lyase
MTQSQLTGEQYPMRNRLKRTCSAMAALMMAMGLPAAAHAQSDADLTSKLLIAILVKKGVLSQSDANSILQEAQAAASEAQATAPSLPRRAQYPPIR